MNTPNGDSQKQSYGRNSIAPTKESFFDRLKQAGIVIDTVVDVGVLSGTPELLEAFPKARHLLIEPMDTHVERIRKLYAKADFRLYNVACSDVDGECFLVHTSIDGTGKVTHTHISATPAVTGIDCVVACKPIRQARLDSMQLPLHGNVLVKIDVDGDELKVLAGSAELLKRTAVVVIEAPMGSLVNRASYLCGRGFRLFEIVDLCYYYKFLSQVDLCFVREDIVAVNSALQPWKYMEFDWQEWVPFGR